MKALVRTKKGKNFTNVELQELKKTTPAAREISVKVTSSRVNPVDLQMMNGMPMVKYKKTQIGGVDGAGIVTEIGSQVSDFKVGDKVLFYRTFKDFGTWAEEISVAAENCAIVPENLDLKVAGAIPLIMMTAYEGIDALPTQVGDTILIHGAAGGVGLCAVQMAKHKGLNVIGTASKKDFDLLTQNGVDELIDYRSQDFSEALRGRKIDLIFDTVGDKTLMKSIELAPRAISSAKFMDPDVFEKGGFKIPGLFKFLMKLGIAKYKKKAKSLNVNLQAVGAFPDGKRLQHIVNDMATYMTPPPFDYLPIAAVDQQSLNEKSIGKVLVMNE